MDDKQIIELYFKRDECAIRETQSKYGAFCNRIAMNILSIREDAEELPRDPDHPGHVPRFGQDRRLRHSVGRAGGRTVGMSGGL